MDGKEEEEAINNEERWERRRAMTQASLEKNVSTATTADAHI